MSTEKTTERLTLPVAADYSTKRGYGMSINGSGQWVLASTAGQKILGILLNKPDGAGAQGTCALGGGIAKVVAGEAISYNDALSVDSSGRAVVADENDEFVFGFAVEVASAAGVQFRAMLTYSGQISVPTKIVGENFSAMTAADDPVLAEFDYTTAPGTTGALQICDVPGGTRFGYWALGAGQTILGPVGAVGGIDVASDQTDNEGLELFTNWGPADGRPLSVGFDAAFFLRVKFSIADVSGCDDLFVGFRKMLHATPYRANMTDYDTYFGLGKVAADGVLVVREELAAAAGAETDTTDVMLDTVTWQFKILVSAAGVATVQHDIAVPGTLAAPTATSAFTFADGDQLIPEFRFLHANVAQAGAIVVKEWEVGYQAA